MSDHVCMCASDCAVTWSTPGKAVAATMDTLCTLLPPHDFHTQFRRIKGTNVKKCETMWALALQPLFHSTDSSSKSKPQFHKLKFDTLTVCISFWGEAVKKFTASLPKEASESKAKETRIPTSHLEHAKRQTRVEQRRNQDWVHAHKTGNPSVFCLANLWARRIKCRPARALDSPCKPQQSHSKYAQQVCTASLHNNCHDVIAAPSIARCYTNENTCLNCCPLGSSSFFLNQAEHFLPNATVTLPKGIRTAVMPMGIAQQLGRKLLLRTLQTKAGSRPNEWWTPSVVTSTSGMNINEHNETN